jgi:hypothetical protein
LPHADRQAQHKARQVAAVPARTTFVEPSGSAAGGEATGGAAGLEA